MYNYYQNPNAMQMYGQQPPGYSPYLQAQAPASPARPIDIIRVNGRNGAEAFQMTPNSRALLLDETDPIIWLCQTDGAGFKTITGYHISPIVEVEKKDEIALLKERIEVLEAKINESNSRSDEPKTKSSK